MSDLTLTIILLILFVKNFKIFSYLLLMWVTTCYRISVHFSKKGHTKTIDELFVQINKVPKFF